MKQEYLDGIKIKEMFFASAQFLDKNKQSVNALNVFPVPDGDTGTNMALTMMAAVKEIQNSKGGQAGNIADAAAKGALKGARGNSGVILSQLLRGFAKGLQGVDKVNTAKYAEALQEGVKTAYKAVMKPVEGTMLTVARVTAEEAVKLAKRISDFDTFYKELIKIAKQTLDKTPDMLTVLREAGVVDSGGMGILYIMMGASKGLKGDIDIEDLPGVEEASISSSADVGNLEDIKYGYCTELFIKNLFPYVEEGDVDKLKEKLEKLGDSLVVVGDKDLIKVHVHTNMPGKVLQLALRFGELSGIKIDNMREQHRSVIEMNEKENEKKNEKEYGFITVAMGDGISSIFKDLSVDYVIEGGQTMNPSIDDILKGIEKTNARNIFILPNNSNIILSAKQAQEISEKNVIVIPSKSIPQGLAALFAFNGEVDLDTNIDMMNQAMGSVKTGQVTYAVRDTVFNGVSIEKGDIIGIADGEISTAGKGIEQVTKTLLSNMLDEDSEIVTLLYGADISEEEAQTIVEFLEEAYPNLDVEVHSGGQPLYYYIISVE